MLPSFVDSAYKRYKNDTSIFVRWLSENGKKCGYDVKTIEQEGHSAPAPAAVKSTRLKGKARKEAKKEQARPPASSKSVEDEAEKPSAYSLVSPKDLVPLATAIATSTKPLITVPADIIRAGLRAVSARKRATAHFVSKTADIETAKSNDGHSYFTSVMEKVILTLQPRFAASFGGGTESDLKSSSTETSFESLANRFSALEVEEPSEQRASEPPSPAPKVAQRAYALEPPKEKKLVEEEMMFAIFCLLEDLQQLRHYVNTMWLDYRIGAVDLITASVTTNVAFQ